MNTEYNSKVSYFTEIFPLTGANLNTTCFRLSPDIDREIGNRLSWRFSQQFSGVIVIWHQKFFWILNKPNEEIPSKDRWKQALENIQKELKQEIGDRQYTIQWFPDAIITPEITAQLAVRVLKIARPFTGTIVSSRNQVNVQREIDYWAETIEINNTLYPALSFTSRSNFIYAGDLADLYKNSPYRQNQDKLLIGLKVRDIERNSFATITEITGTIGELGKKLISEATGAVSKQSLLTTLEEEPEQPVVAVKFGKNKKQFEYAMKALRPCITSDTASKFDVNYGELLKLSKIEYSERKELLSTSKQHANKILNEYGIQVGNAINSIKYPNLFFTPSIELDKTPLLFGNNFRGIQKEILKGLSQGGVYRRHQDFVDASKPINLAALKLCDCRVRIFLQQVEARLKKYKFNTIIADENKQAVPLNNLVGADARAEVEEAIDEIMINEPDIVFVFLPESDRNADEQDSLYSWVNSRLLRRGIASQVIYEDTLKIPSDYVLNQVIPGVLAKLGNLPFVLAEELKLADYFIGLDVSRGSKKKATGSVNACASVRLYGKRGEFAGYKLESEIIEGEEIPQRVLENFIPKNKLQGKRVLIYRDGRFCGDEVKHLQARAKAIDAIFILVECAKSRIPRLYNWTKPNLSAPSQGLGLKLSQYEAIVITTSVTEKIGLPLPLRLKIIDAGGFTISIEDLVNTTLKLTLLHHGSLKSPRLPIPLFGSDRIAYRRLQGIYPGTSEGDRQFWL